jgi:alpha-N-arabinofuranosidase
MNEKTFPGNMADRRILSILVYVLCIVVSFPHASAEEIARVLFHGGQCVPRMNLGIFTQFAEQHGSGTYGGVWGGKSSSIHDIRGYRRDVVRVPVVRWPGGCYADKYQWRDGIGPVESRMLRSRHAGNDANTFGTHEFMGSLDLIGAKADLCANLGDAIPQEASDWMKYMFAFQGSTLANESSANPHPTALYFYTYLHHADHERVVEGYGQKGFTVGSDQKDWDSTLADTVGMKDMIAKHAAIIDKYDPEKRVWLAIDEWGSWYKPNGIHAASSLYQDNTIRDALTVAINLNICVQHADRGKLTAIAQMISLLQSNAADRRFPHGQDPKESGKRNFSHTAT